MAETTKTPAKKPAAKPAAKKPAAKPAVKKAPAKKPVEHKAEHTVAAPAASDVAVVTVAVDEKPVAAISTASDGRYTFATGRRKTSVANIRLFNGKGKSSVNHKELADYFSGYELYINQAVKPMQLTGTENTYYAFINVKGGGKNSQAQAIAHGIATAITLHDPQFRKVLKKNGMLTRDSRMKERKKPGLKRARRGPQWAKR